MSTDARGGAAGDTSAWEVSKVSGSWLLSTTAALPRWRAAMTASGAAPFWIVLARCVRFTVIDTSCPSDRGKDLVKRSGLGRRPTSLTPAGAMKLSVTLPNMVSGLGSAEKQGENEKMGRKGKEERELRASR